jgi:hypothetical protein
MIWYHYQMIMQPYHKKSPIRGVHTGIYEKNVNNFSEPLTIKQHMLYYK